MTHAGLTEARNAMTVPAVLVVDDNAAKRVALRVILAPLGLPVVEADSGRAAVSAVEKQSFAMILMDVRMPIMDGYETARLCRGQDGCGHTPIIFVTANSSDETQASAYASGAVDFIFAPIPPDVLRAKVSAFVDLFRQSEELERSLGSITALNSELRNSEIRIHAVLDNVADGIFIVDDRGVIESVNRSGRELFGFGCDDPVGQPFASVIAAERREELQSREAVRAGPPTATARSEHVVETQGRRRDGSTFTMELERSEMEHGSRVFTLACVRDISERKAHTDALEHQTLHDGLTGLANRTLFSDHVSRSIAAATRLNETRAVLMMDLDGFKQVNDTLGHDRGDALLKQVAERLGATLRRTDTVARLGGDEFGILPGGAIDLSGAGAMAWKIEQMCEPGFVIDDETVHVTPSIGIALFPEHGDETADLLHRADLAMYVAKRSGNRHAVFDAAGDRRKADHVAFLLELRQCVAREELVLHYQPIVDLATQKVHGVEALVRWRHPTRGLLAPAGFMLEVERADLIADVTRWVLNEALRQQHVWRDEGLDLTMAVNISAHSLRDSSSLPDTVAELTGTWATAPERLTLELTEGALIETAAAVVLARLHEMGERLSIDDFGTGYSSLAYLQRLPVDEIKVDQSFMKSLTPASDDAIIVRSTIDLAHNLDLNVVAEGVEDEAVLQTLLEYACDGAQGYLFSPPLSGADLGVWFEDSPYAAGEAHARPRLKAPV